MAHLETDRLREEEAYNELCCYTLTHVTSTFIHQHVVDAYAAQTATPQTRPIRLTFALVGLYLHVERGRSGREVQRVHTLLARRRANWPRFELPDERGAIRVSDVVHAEPGAQRNALVEAWCQTVWNAFRADRQDVIDLLQYELG
jgi:hypothetical protein